MPAVRGDARDVNDAVFAELTYHAAYDPQRAIRTRRHKYVRRWGERDLPVLPNIDDSPSKDLLLQHGLAETPRPREELYDLLFDPNEAHDLARDPHHADVLATCAAGSRRGWSRPTTRCSRARSPRRPAPRSTTRPAARRPRRPAATRRDPVMAPRVVRTAS